MKKFIVGVSERWMSYFSIEAENEEDAIRRVANCEGDSMDDRFQYIDLLDEDTWEVAEDLED